MLMAFWVLFKPYIFLSLLLIFTIIHLYYSWKDIRKGRAITKPFLLLFLILYYVTGANEPSVLLTAALTASWLGDILLIPRSNLWFTLGGISFSLSHILLIWEYTTRIDFSNVPWALIVPVAILYYIVATVIICQIRQNTPMKLLIPMYGYMLANGTMNAFALMLLCTNPCLGSSFVYIGALSFFLSDCALLLVRFHKNKNLIFKRHFTVMLTYVLAEFLITQGILYLS